MFFGLERCISTIWRRSKKRLQVRRDKQLGRIAEFRVAQHILVTASETGHSAHRMVQEVIEGAVTAEHVLLRLPSFIAAALVAAETDGVATLPANLAMSIKDRLQLATFHPPVKMPLISVAQYWHARYHQDPSHRWLRQTCFGLFGRSA